MCTSHELASGFVIVYYFNRLSTDHLTGWLALTVTILSTETMRYLICYSCTIPCGIPHKYKAQNPSWGLAVFCPSEEIFAQLYQFMIWNKFWPFMSGSWVTIGIHFKCHVAFNNIFWRLHLGMSALVWSKSSLFTKNR